MSDSTPHIAPSLSQSGSLSPSYFDQLYTQSADPWEFATSLYEAAKYTATLAALPRQIYANALELGCSIGVLTRQLAERCSALLAIDVSAAALVQARDRCADCAHVKFECRDLACGIPVGQFDLIILSEVGYYFSPTDLETLRQNIADSLVPGGHLLLVHYTGKTNYPQTADAVHDAFLSRDAQSWTKSAGYRSGSYRLDLLIKHRSQ